MKEKDRLIRQFKGERDSLFEELKNQQSGAKSISKKTFERPIATPPQT